MKIRSAMGRPYWLVLMVAAGVIAASTPQAGAVLTVTNGNFETGAGNNVDNVTGWYDFNSGNFWENAWQTDNGAITPNGSAVVVFSSFASDDFGAPSVDYNDGCYLYQSIGTADGMTTLDLSFDWGAPNDDPGGRDLGMTVGVYAYDGLGGFTAADSNDVRSAASGVTLLDSKTFTLATTGVDGLISNVVTSLDISGAGSQELFLRFNSYNVSLTESWPVLDNVLLATEYPPFHTIVVSPSGAGATNPVTLKAVIQDWAATFVSASMELDGSPVTPDSTNTVSGTTTVSYDAGNLAAGSTHTGKVVAVGSIGDPMTNQWTFTVLGALTFISGSPSGAGASATPTIEVVIADGDSDLDAGNVTLYVDNTSVSVDYTDLDTPVAGQTTLGGNWLSTLDPGTVHTGKVVYAGINPSAGPFTNTWTFAVAGDPGFGIYIGDTNAPTPGADDIFQFDAPVSDYENIGGNTNENSAFNDGSTYVAFDKDLHQGQLFTTGSGSSSYELSSVWVKHVGYTNFVGNGTFYNLVLADSDKVTVRIVDPSQADTAGFVLRSEVLQVITNSLSGGGDNGTGNWIEFRLQTPVVLSGNTQYGFDLMIASDVVAYFELAGVTNNPYGGGSAYTTAPRGALNTGTTHATGDRTFLLELAPYTGGPTVAPDITSFSVSGGSATLMWVSETGVNYDVMHKNALTDPTWTSLTSVVGSAGSTMATVPAASSKEYFSIEGN